MRTKELETKTSKKRNFVFDTMLALECVFSGKTTKKQNKKRVSFHSCGSLFLSSLTPRAFSHLCILRYSFAKKKNQKKKGTNKPHWNPFK
jgi:hypothetical protein